MRFARVRSGLRESFHDAIVIALRADGEVLLASGDVDQPLFYRSAVKPFQALAARRTGLDLAPERLAITCASHGGYPVHLALVDAVLTDHGFTTDDLQCALDRPLSPDAARLQASLGHPDPERRYHNCSGKHAGWLAACATAGWDPTTYLEPDHPLQLAIRDVIADYTGLDPNPVGVDGCGAPTMRGSTAGLARAFSRLTVDAEISPIADAMTRFSAVVDDNVSGYGRVGVNWGGPTKTGAEGLFAMSRHGVAIVAKAQGGANEIATAACLTVADMIGALPEGTAEWLADVRSPAVLGGGRVVGSLELVSA